MEQVYFGSWFQDTSIMAGKTEQQELEAASAIHSKDQKEKGKCMYAWCSVSFLYS